MRNIALFLTYLGTAYHGWQVQKNDITVGETMEKATAAVVGHKVKMTGCGRTDAGVHAKRYVANFRTTSRIPVDRLPYALNTHLPEDIVVTDAMEVHNGFNAIGSCVRKEYTYLIYNSRIGDPFYVNRAWFYPKHLDETIMQQAASQFVGTHDFAAVRIRVGDASPDTDGIRMLLGSVHFHLDREVVVLAEEILYRVDIVLSHVGQSASVIVPVSAECLVDTVRIVRLVWCRPEPHVIVEA